MMKTNFFAATIAIMGCVLFLAACGGGGGSGPTVTQPTPDPDDPRPTQPTADPAYHLGTVRFTTHQPDVLEQIGAHHAYARGLTGRGVRIGIQDTIVDYTQTAEFGNRVRLRDADGASLYYLRPFGDAPGSDIDVCRRARTCDIWGDDSRGDPEAYNSWVRGIVHQEGWPTSDDSSFIADQYYSEGSGLGLLYRWREVPTPYDGPGDGGHGTIVASVAAGENLGVAPEATIIPIAINLTDDHHLESLASVVLQETITMLPPADRRQFDSELASVWRDHYEKFDIINRSYGTDFFESDIIAAEVDATLQWYRSYLPNTLDAFLQSGIPNSEKTILVYAAGNRGAGLFRRRSGPALLRSTVARFLSCRRRDRSANGRDRVIFKSVRPSPTRLERRETRPALLPSRTGHGKGTCTQPEFARTRRRERRTTRHQLCGSTRLGLARAAHGTLSGNARKHGDRKADARYGGSKRAVR